VARPRRIAAVVLAGACALATAGGTAAYAESASVSPRNASYRIEATLDHVARTIDGREVLSWRNLQQRPTAELRFHLYWNAWRNDRSTWLLESRLGARRRRRALDDVRDGDWGWIDVRSVRLLAGGGEDADRADPPEADLTDKLRFESPDDGNPDDRTVLVVALPREVAPGETVQLELTWKAKIPRTFARTGVRGDFFFVAHWFPAVGVFEPEGWNCHQFHAATEFFSDYGTYDVSLTLPHDYVVGATGVEVERRDNDDGSVTRRWRQADVHGFTWTASPDYVGLDATFDEADMPLVKLHLLLQPEHLRQAGRHFDAVRTALKYYGTWFGPYPYGHLTVIDPAWGSDAGGMEYPTLFTCGTRLFAPVGGDAPESVTIHEAGHQFWYGVVGNNEFEHAWLDEGINTYAQLRVLDAAYPPRVLVERYLRPPGERDTSRGFLPLTFRDIPISRWTDRTLRYRSATNSDAPRVPTYLYYPPTAAAVSYDKTALWLRTLELHLGWDTLRAILAEFFTRYRFAHPRPEDFFAVAEEVSGQDLSWFFDQVYNDSVVFDYAVESVSSLPAAPRGWVESNGALELQERKPSAGEQGAIQRTEVVVRRLGGGVFPVDVLLAFDDGYEQRETWDGREHWKRIVVERPARLKHAIVDPDGKLALDAQRTNNSRVLDSHAQLPAVKWSSKWMIWLQDLMQAMAFFV